MALSDFFKRKKEVVKEDNVDLLEDLFNDDKDYIKQLEVKNEYINSLKILIKKYEELDEFNKKVTEKKDEYINVLEDDIKGYEKLNEFNENLIEKYVKMNEVNEKIIEVKDKIIEEKDEIIKLLR